MGCCFFVFFTSPPSSWCKSRQVVSPSGTLKIIGSPWEHFERRETETKREATSTPVNMIDSEKGKKENSPFLAPAIYHFYIGEEVFFFFCLLTGPNR